MLGGPNDSQLTKRVVLLAGSRVSSKPTERNLRGDSNNLFPMAIDFVLDEDIYQRAMEAECTEMNFDLRAARVVDILQVDHRWVISPAVEVAYRRRFDQVECQGAFETLF